MFVYFSLGATLPPKPEGFDDKPPRPAPKKETPSPPKEPEPEPEPESEESDVGKSCGRA